MPLQGKDKNGFFDREMLKSIISLPASGSGGGFRWRNDVFIHFNLKNIHFLFEVVKSCLSLSPRKFRLSLRSEKNPEKKVRWFAGPFFVDFFRA
jgi:hypothetical protein